MSTSLENMCDAVPDHEPLYRQIVEDMERMNGNNTTTAESSGGRKDGVVSTLLEKLVKCPTERRAAREFAMTFASIAPSVQVAVLNIIAFVFSDNHVVAALARHAREEIEDNVSVMSLYKARNDALNKEIAAEKKRMDVLKELRERMVDSNATAKAAVDALRKVEASAKQEASSLQTVIANRRDSVKGLRAQLRALEQEHNRALEALEEQGAAVLRHAAQVDELHRRARATAHEVAKSLASSDVDMELLLRRETVARQEIRAREARVARLDDVAYALGRIATAGQRIVEARCRAVLGACGRADEAWGTIVQSLSCQQPQS
jgi:hypothetical protein